jgi:hypothetical protein
MYEELIGRSIDQLVILMAVDDKKEPLVFEERTEDHINNLVEHIQFYRNNK